MNLKKAILSVIGRDRLRQVVDGLELDGVDRRSAKAMRSALSRARRAAPASLLEYLSESEVKEVCDSLGISNRGRRAALVQKLLTSQEGGAETREDPGDRDGGGSVTDNGNEERGGGSPTGAESPATVTVTKTELVWPGKYNPDGSRKQVPRVSLPFQVIERVNESRATREVRAQPQASLFDVYEGKEGETFEEGWTNKLIWGDNLLVMGSLLEKFAGKVDLIYIDPPFATGADFSFRTDVGDALVEVHKEQSILEEKAYRDTWGQGIESYIAMLASRLALMRELLADDGVILVHIDWRVVHYVRGILDSLFGKDGFRNEIIWSYRTGGAPRSGSLPRKHDNILMYVKGNDRKIRPLRERQYLAKQFMGSRVDSEGRHYVDTILRDVVEGEIQVVEDGESLRSLNTRPVLNLSTERLGFDTQKPEGLLSLLLEIASEPGDLVADFFLGSGTTAAAAERLERRWIGCDLGRWAIHVSRKRLLGIQGAAPFEVLNLGKYERQYWQVATFGEDLDDDGQVALYEYLAFVLKLFNASPVSGMSHLHGKKGRAMVHIGPVDAPVTIDEINEALDECIQMKQLELHVLGWEWEMGLAGPNNDYRHGGLMHEVAKKKGVKLALLQIPREVMEEQAAVKGDVTFFELAYVDVDIKTKKRSVAVQLKDFVIPNTELIPEEVRDKVKKWSDYIDYWAVDWDFQSDTFMQGWVTYRTRKDRKLALTSEPHTYEAPGKYRILVKVIDIFGNDTSQAYDIEVR